MAVHPRLGRIDAGRATTEERGQGPETRGSELAIGYLTRDRAAPVTPYFDPPPHEPGLWGARLAVDDNNTTGRFTHQSFALVERRLDEGGDLAESLRQLIVKQGVKHVLLDLPPADIRALSSLPEAAEVLLYDVGSADDGLRAEGCAVNVLHLLPSRAMLADALAQFLAKKRWAKWFLIVGPAPEDQLFAYAVERAAKRFGGRIVERRPWTHTFDERRTPESEIPVFTQGVDYDVVIVADEAGAFGDLLPYRTWNARPVVGTQGLVPIAWHRTHEIWGALQLQNRFRERAGRWMGVTDYGAWLAVRAIGEAATRTASIDFAALRDYLLGDRLALAGFKGVPLSFRRWDGQLRQPVLLADERSLVAVAPIEGFIHPRNELDTLGYDESETGCHARR
ncbi:MAG: ABC transporter substrate-binding protein [Methylotetracoccus sp.]